MSIRLLLLMLLVRLLKLVFLETVDICPAYIPPLLKRSPLWLAWPEFIPPEIMLEVPKFCLFPKGYAPVLTPVEVLPIEVFEKKVLLFVPVLVVSLFAEKKLLLIIGFLLIDWVDENMLSFNWGLLPLVKFFPKGLPLLLLLEKIFVLD